MGIFHRELSVVEKAHYTSETKYSGLYFIMAYSIYRMKLFAKQTMKYLSPSAKYEMLLSQHEIKFAIHTRSVFHIQLGIFHSEAISLADRRISLGVCDIPITNTHTPSVF